VRAGAPYFVEYRNGQRHRQRRPGRPPTYCRQRGCRCVRFVEARFERQQLPLFLAGV